MKELIVILGTVLLGCVLYQWILGGDDSLRAACGNLLLETGRRLGGG